MSTAWSVFKNYKVYFNTNPPHISNAAYHRNPCVSVLESIPYRPCQVLPLDPDGLLAFINDMRVAMGKHTLHKLMPGYQSPSWELHHPRKNNIVWRNLDCPDMNLRISQAHWQIDAQNGECIPVRWELTASTDLDSNLLHKVARCMNLPIAEPADSLGYPKTALSLPLEVGMTISTFQFGAYHSDYYW